MEVHTQFSDHDWSEYHYDTCYVMVVHTYKLVGEVIKTSHINTE